VIVVGLPVSSLSLKFKFSNVTHLEKSGITPEKKLKKTHTQKSGGTITGDRS
jgi:hypothetical protein